MARDYTPQTWTNLPATTTPVSAARLTYIEEGLDDAVEDLQAHESAAAPHSGHETPAGAQTRVDNHAALTNPHSATDAATASRLVLRDGSARAKFADPTDAADAATKGYVDTTSAAAAATRAALAHTHKVLKELVFAVAGNLIVGDNAATFDHDSRDGLPILYDVVARVKTAPLSQSIRINLAYSNDDLTGRTDLFAAGNRPTIVAGQKRGTGNVFGVTSIPAAKRIQLDVDQIGVGTVGADLIVYLRYYELTLAETA